VSLRRRRIRRAIGIASAVAVLGLAGLWFAGLDAGSPGVVGGPSPSRVYPQMWPPGARGAAWLAAGAAAVAFDVFIVRAGAETQRGRDLAGAFAVVTGVAFAALAVGAFLSGA